MKGNQRSKEQPLTIKRFLGGIAVVSWLVLAGFLQRLLGPLTVETYVSVAIAGFYVIYEYALPRYINDTWRTRFNWVLGLLTVVYVGYVLSRAMTLLPEGARLF